MFYVYLHIRLDTGRPFYVGKGLGKRSEIHSNKSKEWKEISSFNGYDIIILESELSEYDSFELEKYWIKRIGRNLLVNKTDGGGSTFGLKHTKESKNKMSASRKGIPTSKKQKQKVASLFKGKFGKEHNRSKSVTCIETGKEYGSQLEAQRELNLGNGSVSWSIKHKKPIFGMHFEHLVK